MGIDLLICQELCCQTAGIWGATNVNQPLTHFLKSFEGMFIDALSPFEQIS